MKNLLRFTIAGVALATLLSSLSCFSKKDILTPEERAWLDERKGEITFSCDPDWPPFEFTDKNGRAEGFAIEYIHLLEKRLKTKFRFVPQNSWESAMKEFRAGKIDILTTVANTPERNDFMLLTPTYYTISSYLFMRDDTTEKFAPEDLSGKRVGVVSGYAAQTYLLKNYKKIITVGMPDIQTALNALSKGYLDAVTESPGVALYHIKNLGLKNLRIAGKIDYTYNMSMGIRKELPILKSILTKGMGTISAEERDELLAGWSKEENTPFSILVIKIFSITAAVIVILYLAYIFILRKFFTGNIVTFKSLLKGKALKILIIAIASAAAVALALIFANREKNLSLTQREKDWLKEQKEIKIGAYINYPPYTFLDYNGKFSGISSDYLKLIEKKIGIKFTYINFETFSEMLAAAKRGEIDIVPGVQDTQDRRNYLDFTSEYLSIKSIIVTRRDSPQLLKMEDLSGQTVSVSEGHAVIGFLKEKYPSIKLDSVKTDLSGLLNTSFGGSFAAITTLPVASYYIAKEGISNLHIAGETGFEYHLSFGVRNEMPHLRSIFQKALTAVQRTEGETILNKWIELDKARFYEEKEFWIATALAGSITLILFLAIIMWNITLKRRVKEKTRELQKALDEVKTLKGFLPVCSNCKKVRDDKGYWSEIDEYISSHADVQVTHSLCNDCLKKLYPEQEKKMRR